MLKGAKTRSGQPLSITDFVVNYDYSGATPVEKTEEELANELLQGLEAMLGPAPSKEIAK